MSAPEGKGRASGDGRAQRPSAAPGALSADAVSVVSASSRAGGIASRLAAAALTPGAAGQPPAPPCAARPGAADAPCAGLAALSLLSPGPGDGAATGRGAPATRQATRPVPPSAAPSRGAGGAVSSSPGAGAFAAPIGAVARGVPGHGQAASPTTARGGDLLPCDGPPEPVGDDGAPLSAEAAASPFSPPASERHAAFLKLVDHGIKAGMRCRYMRCADFSALAAEAGVPLFGGDSIIVANLRVSQVFSLSHQAGPDPDIAEAEALDRQAWAVLLSQALPVLQSRMDKGTLLPGKLRKVEEAYAVYEQQTIDRNDGSSAVRNETALHPLACLMGYDTALHAATTALALLTLRPRRSDECGRAQAFVLATLRLIPKVSDMPGNELELVNMIERHMTADKYGADFCASVLALWRSRPVVDVLRSRGSLQNAAPLLAEHTAEFEARKQADLAKRGLLRCALPSCSKQETTVLQFRVCGHCQTTRYCCPEHAKQHWKAHKRQYEEEEGEASSRGAGVGASA